MGEESESDEEGEESRSLTGTRGRVGEPARKRRGGEERDVGRGLFGAQWRGSVREDTPKGSGGSSQSIGAAETIAPSGVGPTGAKGGLGTSWAEEESVPVDDMGLPDARGDMFDGGEGLAPGVDEAEGGLRAPPMERAERDKDKPSPTVGALPAEGSEVSEEDQAR